MFIKMVILLTYTFSFFECSNIHPTENSASGSFTEKQEARKGQFSFSVLFYEKSDEAEMSNYKMPICSGAIITPRWILTTATPLGNYKLGTYFMIAGVSEIPLHPQIILNQTGNIYEIEAITVHPDWYHHNYSNVGMAKTSRTLILGKDLGLTKISNNLFASSDNKNIVCDVGIWRVNVYGQNLLRSNKEIAFFKQIVQFQLNNVCPKQILTNKILCIQLLPNDKKEVCSVKQGAIVRCNCKVVGLVNGNNNKIECVNSSSLKFTAVNLVAFKEWIHGVTSIPISRNYTYRHYSTSKAILVKINIVTQLQLFCIFIFANRIY